MMEGEIIDAEIMGKSPTVETVNNHLLEKLDTLILSIDAKTDPELVKVLTESVAKYNSSIKNSSIFEPKETEEEREAKARSAVLGDILK